MLTNDSIASRASPAVLLAGEDGSFNAFVIYVFQQIGVQVVAEADGKRLDKRLSKLRPDVLLVDSRLPGVDVRALCAQLRLERQTRSLAILVLLASGDERHGEEFLASGADECLDRPLMPEKLVARVLAALRHSPRHSAAPQVLTFHDLEIDLAAYIVRRNGQIIHLAPIEFRLLVHFMRNPRRVHSRNELQLAAWPRDIHLGTRTVDVHVGRLRQALRTAGSPDPIRTVRSVGYALAEDATSQAPPR
ncbi:MAG: response regulator [Rhodospirillales bacterium]|nr:response regulator [Rhodospirillales bacterium]